MSKLAGLLLLELWFVLGIAGSPILEWDLVERYVQAVSSMAPAIHNFANVASNAREVAFLLAVSPLFLVPKVVFVVQWLHSDRMRNFRYLVVSPLSRVVPKRPLDFVTDPLRTDKENASLSRVQQISMGRTIFISIATLVLALMIGLFWPYVVAGTDIARGRPADFRELMVAQGGWKLWFSWSVYQMCLSAFLLAVGCCVLVEYWRWFKGLLTKK